MAPDHRRLYSAQRSRRAVPVIATYIDGHLELVREDYLFSKKSVGQIMSLISSIEKEDLENMAKENFEKSKNYLPSVLDPKREAFFKSYLESVVK